MIKIIVTSIIILFSGLSDCWAQYAYFATRGTIDFDRVVYTKARVRNDMRDNDSRRNNRGSSNYESRLENMPESNTSKMQLSFDEHSTLLIPIETEQQNTNTPARGAGRNSISGGRRGGNMQNNNANKPNNARAAARTKGQRIIFQNLKDNKAEIQLEIDEKYLLTDSLAEITWRFTEEYRSIAGINCRRVNGATKDSLYLIAYYTDEIPLAAGPALSHGLPGMILGLVIPEMHIQYWATGIRYSNDLVPQDWRDNKSKKMDLDSFSTAFGRFMPRNRQNQSFKRRIFEGLIY